MVFRVLAKIFYIALLVIETLIAIRFVFKLIGAEDSNFLVNLVYQASNVFIEPFTGIISGDWTLGPLYFDLDALLALAIYMILAFVMIELIKVFGPDTQRS
jgi:hypothetical protein